MLTEEERLQLDKIYREHKNLVKTMCKSKLRYFDIEDIEDLTQSAWEVICKKYPEYDAARGRIAPWLAVIVVNTLKNLLREQGSLKRGAQLSASSLEFLAKGKL